MVANGICTYSRYEPGVIKIVDHMDRALEHLYRKKHVIVLSYHNKVNNEWGGDK